MYMYKPKASAHGQLTRSCCYARNADPAESLATADGCCLQSLVGCGAGCNRQNHQRSVARSAWSRPTGYPSCPRMMTLQHQYSQKV